jgi:hypothetical protein
MIDSNSFCIKIERLVKERRMDIMDAVLHYCQENEMEIETAATLLNRNKKIMELLEIEAKGNRLLKDNTMYATLPIDG